MASKQTQLVAEDPQRGGWCSMDGSRQSGSLGRALPVPDEAQFAQRQHLREQIQRVVSEEDFEMLLRVECDGISLAEHARAAGEHRGTAGRRYARLKARLKVPLLAVVASRLLHDGADGFTLCPRSAEPLWGVDQWCVGVGGERRYPDTPGLEDLRDFIVENEGRLYGEPGVYLGCWFDENAGQWVLELTRLYAPLAAAVAAGLANGQGAVYHLRSGQVHRLSTPHRRAA